MVNSDKSKFSTTQSDWIRPLKQIWAEKNRELSFSEIIKELVNESINITELQFFSILKGSFDTKLAGPVFNMIIAVGRKRGRNREERKTINNYSLDEFDRIQESYNELSTVEMNQFIELEITYYKPPKSKVVGDELLTFNETLFNTIKQYIKSQQQNPQQAALTTVELNGLDYYNFLFMLFIYDPVHDFQKAWRGQMEKDSTATDIKRLTKECMSSLHKKLIDEKSNIQVLYANLFDGVVGAGMNESKKLYDKLVDFEKVLSGNLENNLLNYSKTYAESENSENSYITYSSTKSYLSQLDNRISWRYSSNNCLQRINDQEIMSNPSVGERINVLLGKTIDSTCISFPGSGFDGSDAGNCGSILSNLKNYSGLQFGDYEILFKIKDISESGVSLKITSKLVMNGDNNIENHVTITRITGIVSALTITTTYIYKILQINTSNVFANETVTVNDELQSFKGQNPTDNNNMHFGGLLRLYQNRTLNFDCIHAVRKGFCDFSQYIQGLLKSGGFTHSYVARSNTIGPYMDVTTVPTTLDFVTRNSGTNTDYPFIALHTDQPATALNLFFLGSIKSEILNRLSHTVYGSSKELFFANMQGEVIKIPLSDKKNKLQGGGVRGEFENYDCQIEEAYEILVDFFALCITFEMDIEYIKLVNKIIKKYFYQEREKKTVKTKKQTTKLYKILEKSTIIKTFVDSPKAYIFNNVPKFDIFIILFKFIDLLVFCYNNNINIENYYMNHKKTKSEIIDMIESIIYDKKNHINYINVFINTFRIDNNINIQNVTTPKGPTKHDIAFSPDRPLKQTQPQVTPSPARFKVITHHGFGSGTPTNRLTPQINSQINSLITSTNRLTTQNPNATPIMLFPNIGQNETSNTGGYKKTRKLKNRKNKSRKNKK